MYIVEFIRSHVDAEHSRIVRKRCSGSFAAPRDELCIFHTSAKDKFLLKVHVWIGIQNWLHEYHSNTMYKNPCYSELHGEKFILIVNIGALILASFMEEQKDIHLHHWSNWLPAWWATPHEDHTKTPQATVTSAKTLSDRPGLAPG